ncbi:hypothetical protein SAMD00019534_064340 [Acytostelium subglobosum LB1]|uniref:hypothetical protein n=1 Tax=Acytostelium subglobosum LB1 TaxID=1410327 RepID=UPI0006450CF8|nr:hypothetical protein SAMD00019534_064340 [Acytostelium subglobosum LB1]GAM23259.1 hypothetical protein SAMD00019534_064340 [Acytostelium subglobosum LB1]|eukprot:XP_012753708.1 hypothetical protein SAMD00019534_064340 [Acytostelium subglobosum LB1]
MSDSHTTTTTTVTSEESDQTSEECTLCSQKYIDQKKAIVAILRKRYKLFDKTVLNTFQYIDDHDDTTQVGERLNLVKVLTIVGLLFPSFVTRNNTLDQRAFFRVLYLFPHYDYVVEHGDQSSTSSHAPFILRHDTTTKLPDDHSNVPPINIDDNGGKLPLYVIRHRANYKEHPNQNQDQDQDQDQDTSSNSENDDESS